MGQFFKAVCGVFVLLAVSAGNARAQTPEIGEIIENVAYLSFQKDDKTLTVVTEPARFEVEAVRTPSTISFYRSAPFAPDARTVNIAETFYSPSHSVDGPFTAYAQGFPFPDEEFDGTINRTTANVRLVPSQHFYSGDISIICVQDPGQNGSRHTRHFFNFFKQLSP